MSINIACSVPGCTKPVIGQCTGYKKTCGRYYCNEHSFDTLCADCGRHRVSDEHDQMVYEEYLALAENVSNNSAPLTDFKFEPKILIQIGVASFFIGLAMFIGISIIAELVTSAHLEISGFFRVFAILFFLVTLFILGWPVVTIPIIYFIKYKAWFNDERQKRIAIKIVEIEQLKPGFINFWNVWEQQRKKEQGERNSQALIAVLTVAGVIAAATVAGVVEATTSESDYDRTRRAVRDEINSL